MDADQFAQRTRRERTPPRVRTPPPRERIFDDTVPVMNYGEDPMVDYGKPTSSRRASKAKSKEPTKENKEKEAATTPAPSATEAKEKASKADKMDVDQKGEESEEGEIAE
jgi:hypothetical protein